MGVCLILPGYRNKARETFTTMIGRVTFKIPKKFSPQINRENTTRTLENIKWDLDRHISTSHFEDYLKSLTQVCRLVFFWLWLVLIMLGVGPVGTFSPDC